MDLEARIKALEERMSALEAENRRLRSQVPAVPVEEKTELTPQELAEIKALARDTKRYGHKVAMEMHGYGRRKKTVT